ncbi:MAG: ANTAR domain-containing protein [Acidimicrobiales bacterium]
MPSREALLADTFLQLADTLVDDFDVIELLTTLSVRCVDLLDAAATGILLADAHRNLHVVAASSEQANLLELFQIQNEEGPCLDAFRTGEAIVHGDLSASSPWPSFGRTATAAGLPSVHAFPMRVRDSVLGTLNLFMGRAGGLASDDVTVAQALAHAATIAVLQDRTAKDANRQSAQLQGALNSRISVEQAKGVVAERAGVGMDEAFRRLRVFARNRNAKLVEVAEAVVSRSLPDADLDALFNQVSGPT